MCNCNLSTVNACSELSWASRGTVARRSEDPRLRAFLGREMLRGAFAAVASAGPNQQAELLHLARDILAMETPFPAAPREVSTQPTHSPLVAPQLQLMNGSDSYAQAAAPHPHFP